MDQPQERSGGVPLKIPSSLLRLFVFRYRRLSVYPVFTRFLASSRSGHRILQRSEGQTGSNGGDRASTRPPYWGKQPVP